MRKKILLFILAYIFNILLILDLVNFNLNKFFVISSILELILFVGIFLLFESTKFKKMKIEKKFIISYLIIGLLYLFLFPIGSLPDELNHFYRSYEVSKGNLISKKCEVGNGYYAGCNTITPEIEKAVSNGARYRNVSKALKYKYSKNSEKKWVAFTNISMYSFICYIPQAIGILFGRILHMPVLIWAYLARLFNFIMFVSLLYFSIIRIPYKKTSIMFIALLPITIQEAISMSADCMAIASSIALVSYILYLRKNIEHVTKKQIIIILILSLLLSMSKLVYLPICIITLILPKEKFDSKKSKYIILGLILLFVGILNLIWLKIASQFLLSIEGNANPNLQMNLIIHSPWRFLAAAYNTSTQLFDYYLNTALGSSLGLFDVLISNVYIKINILILIFLIFFDKIKERTKVINYIGLFISIVVILLIYTSLYLDWTPVGKNIIDGIQGRYFVPILPLILIGLSSDLFTIKENNIFKQKNILIIMLFESIYVITYLLNYY